MPFSARFGGLTFTDPAEIYAPVSVSGALRALDHIDEALGQGYWIAGAMSYELGAALQGIAARPSADPLLVIGVCKPPPLSRHDLSPEAKLSAPLARIDPTDYERNVRAILRLIRDGEVYQVNYTVPFDAGYAGEPLDLYRRLLRHSAARYAAFLQHDDLTLVSLSPELFMRFDGQRITTKPMKGTASLSDIGALQSDKNRAEHVMIVDLLRNDLHRIADDVRVERLFEIERYPTFATMTSTISGDVSDATPFREIVQAMFPCGSVTGAPKRAAMHFIRELEPEARGFYTGSIGFLAPERRGWWNVAIRTLQFTGGAPCARFDSGGGIVSDSEPADEWNELLLKARFLQSAIRDFALLETLRAGSGASDIDAHLARLERSAKLFGFDFDRASLRSRIATPQAATPIVHARLYADGRSSIRRDAETSSNGRPVRLCFSTATVRSDDPMLVHKTSWRPAHAVAAREAADNDCFDALLRNERGEITEGSRTNVYIRINGTLCTPPLRCGLLPGILRAQLLAGGTAVERVIYESDLLTADEVYVGNSARGLLPALLGQSHAKSPVAANIRMKSRFA